MEQGLSIVPQLDQVVITLADQAKKFLEYAEARQVIDAESSKDATRDLGLIANTKKAIEAKRQEFVGPLNTQLKEFNDFFKTISGPITVADQVTRSKVLAYNAEIERKRSEAERIDQEKLRLAQEEGALTGEHTVDLTSVDKPEATPDRVRTDVGMSSKMMIAKWEVEDLSLVPADYMMIDSAKVGKVVRASKGDITIPGIRIWLEPTLQVRSS